MIKRAPRKPSHRTRLPATFQPTAPAVIWTAAIATAKLRLTTNVPVVIQALPTGITVQGVAPTAVTQVSSTSFDLTYPSSVVTTNVVVVPSNVPQIRSAPGGYLNAGTVTL